MAARHTNSEKSAATPIDLADLLGHAFHDPALLQLALTHRSLVFESHSSTGAAANVDNERLEFVGDAVIGLLIADALYRRFPQAREGDLTRLRASLVSRKSLAEAAARLDLGRHLLLGKGEEQSGGRRKPALLANVLEAIVAALYLDGGLSAAQHFVEQHLLTPVLPRLEAAINSGPASAQKLVDPKSALQEHMQATGAGQPRYVLIAETGPDHRKHFAIEVHSSTGQVLASAEGSTKKEAQQNAATLALHHLRAAKSAS